MVNKIKILHFGMSPNIGGIEKYIFNVFSYLNKEKFNFNFVTYREARLAFEQEFEKEGCVFYRLKHKRKRFLNRKTKKELYRFLVNNKFDVVEMHVVDLYDILPVVVARKAKVKKIIIHSHASSYYGNPTLFVRLMNFVNRIVIRFYKPILIGCSKDSLDFTFGKPNKGIVVTNGINLEQFYFNQVKRMEFRKRHHISNDALVFSNVGRLCKEKNQKYAIDVFNKYYLNHTNSYFFIAGEGDMKSELMEYTSHQESSDNIIFLGNVNDTCFLYSGSDVFLFPSLSEGFGIAIIEAEACGLQCVTSSGIPYEISENDLVHKLDLKKTPLEWVNFIDFLNLKYDRVIKGKENTKAFSIKETIKQLEGIYR